VGDLVALGPLRRVLLPLYQRWINNLGTVRMSSLMPRPMTEEQQREWYEQAAKSEDAATVTMYERASLRPTFALVNYVSS